MIEKFNQEDNSYTHYIHISEFEKFCEGVKKISNRIKYETFGEEPDESEFNGEYHLIIDDAKSLEDCIKTQANDNIEAIFGMYRGSFLLECCLRSAGLEGIEYLINRGAEINRTNVLGDNALHMLILNDNMAEENKIKAAQMLIDKSIDVNRPNIRMETPLMAALNHLEFDVASLLIDNGGYILRPPAQKETEDNSTKENTEKTIN